MTRHDTLGAWLAQLESAHPIEIDMGLDRVGRVKAALQLSFTCPVITVGGTNGKGSTCVMLEAILLTAGYSVGCYLSPHVLTFNERARIDGRQASDEDLLLHFEAVERARQGLPEPVTLTYFEFTTLAVLHWLAASNLDAVILEIGMGGRLDAVNLIDADCSVVTNVAIDHIAYLGKTREQIGLEKAGIFRAGRPAICADPAPPQSLLDHAQRLGTDLWLIDRDFSCERQDADSQAWTYVGRETRRPMLRRPALFGAHQVTNASTVLACLEVLRDRLPVFAHHIRRGLESVVLPGRFEVWPGRPAVILDVCHNPHAAIALRNNLQDLGNFARTVAVFGAMQDKDVAGIIRPLIAEIDHWYVTDLPIPRAATAEQLERVLCHAGVPVPEAVTRCASPALALDQALEQAAPSDRVVVFGSFVTVGGVEMSTASTVMILQGENQCAESAVSSN
ncbi:MULTISPECIES: bifunctional tetrahydrofolate synthase/dihydrofolate synthase [unclassified Burkholderia]|uniref:bifunctional tetrahydrofolate synthase/dihydrofolate synthase n=1 Tax=unclassified Burkholderia TaxID=2613784 RepID=UPI0009ECAAB4|nr:MULTISPECIES: bifunctional tetrahydrofolate synthase/dihydrofolate synthase [unclassified Burkholderia]